jgi:hypothetical protein
LFNINKDVGFAKNINYLLFKRAPPGPELPAGQAGSIEAQLQKQADYEYSYCHFFNKSGIVS